LVKKGSGLLCADDSLGNAERNRAKAARGA